jgi:hypothetical protein
MTVYLYSLGATDEDQQSDCPHIEMHLEGQGARGKGQGAYLLPAKVTGR